MTIHNHAAVALALNGFTDEQLESLCRIHSPRETGVSWWATHESESTSLGKTFRFWTGYPKIFPLFICSDHAVHWESRCWPNEVNNRYKTFFTWNKSKNEKMRKLYGISSHHVPHPWVHYRREKFGQLSPNRKGTLVYLPHANGTTTPIYQNFEQYMTDLKGLDEKYQPVVICLSADEINKGVHKELRQYEIPLVTAGIGRSQSFVDRFYSVLYQFEYATSPNIGSHTFYVLEAGISFFLFGPYPQYLVTQSDSLPDGLLNWNDFGTNQDLEKLEIFKSMLRFPPQGVNSSELNKLLVSYLGLDSDTTPFAASIILWRQLFYNIPSVLKQYSIRSFVFIAQQFFPKSIRIKFRQWVKK